MTKTLKVFFIISLRISDKYIILSIFNKHMKILFGVFDWGLGHATRDIPLIEELLKEKNRVDIISTGWALKLLKVHFKGRCRYFDVPSITSPYQGRTSIFLFNFISIIPQMLVSLRKIRKLSRRIIKEGGYDKIVSDCRYDVHDQKDNSYLINHQLRFKSVFFTEIFTDLWLAYIMKPYGKILVPDFPGEGLTGRLSHGLPFVDKNRIEYLGILSAMKRKNVKKDIDYFISLSGPEPQRTMLEKQILQKADMLHGKIILAGGNPDAEHSFVSNKVKFHSFLSPRQQEDCMNRAKFLIIRSGYTTIMELCELGIKSALLIPAPGQTEQEYLADLYERRGYFHHQHQNRPSIVKDIEKSRDFKGFRIPWSTKESVMKFMDILKK